MIPFQTALPGALTAQIAGQTLGSPVKVVAQDETRLGLWPIIRRRITACGVQPVRTVTHKIDNFYLYGAVEPTTYTIPPKHCQMLGALSSKAIPRLPSKP
jgi:hypothetical protein